MSNGIVTCAGGQLYFTCAWIMIKMLRYLGCTLPIELWYMGKELNLKMIQLIESLDVKCINAYDLQETSPIKTLNSWELKIYAIKNSSFTNVLFIDADNVPACDPTFLFDSKQYLEYGALFWPDKNIITTFPETWEKLSIQNVEGREFESGQLLINKDKCADAINYAYDLNNDSGVFYKYFFGDKDIFRAAWLKTNTPFYFMPNPNCLNDSSIYYQHDFDGNILFQHRTGCKWLLKTTNISPSSFIHKKQCGVFLNELRQKWDGVVRNLPGDFEQAELAMYDELISNEYDLTIGNIKKKIRFYTNFEIKGGLENETNWMIDTNKDGQARVSLGTKTRKTCYLTGTPLSGLYLYQNRPVVTLIKCSLTPSSKFRNF